MAGRKTRLDLTRTQILAFRRAVQALDERLPRGMSSLRQAAWADLQDSMPRAALLSLHVRVQGTKATAWQAPSLVQLWRPRYSAFVVDARDAAVFTVGRLPDTGSTARVAESLADRLARLPGDTRMTQSDAARALGEPPNRWAPIHGWMQALILLGAFLLLRFAQLSPGRDEVAWLQRLALGRDRRHARELIQHRDGAAAVLFDLG